MCSSQNIRSCSFFAQTLWWLSSFLIRKAKVLIMAYWVLPELTLPLFLCLYPITLFLLTLPQSHWPSCSPWLKQAHFHCKALACAASLAWKALYLSVYMACNVASLRSPLKCHLVIGFYDYPHPPPHSQCKMPSRLLCPSELYLSWLPLSSFVLLNIYLLVYCLSLSIRVKTPSSSEN